MTLQTDGRRGLAGIDGFLAGTADLRRPGTLPQDGEDDDPRTAPATLASSEAPTVAMPSPSRASPSRPWRQRTIVWSSHTIPSDSTGRSEIRSRTWLDEHPRFSDRAPLPPGLLAVPAGNLTQQWRETRSRDLSGRIPAIVRELEKATVEIAQLVEEGERQAEIERQRWEVQREQ